MAPETISHYSGYTEATDPTLVEVELKLRLRFNPGALDTFAIPELVQGVAEALTDYHDEHGLFEGEPDDYGNIPDELDLTSVTCEYVSQRVVDRSVTPNAD